MQDVLLRIAFTWGLPTALIVSMAAFGPPTDIVSWIGVTLGAMLALGIHGAGRDLRAELVAADDD